MLRIAKDTWQSKKIHQNVYIRKSEKHLVMQKGSWFKVNIQKVGKCGMYWNLIDISIYVLYNSFFFYIVERYFSSMEINMVILTTLKPYIPLFVITLFLYSFINKFTNSSVLNLYFKNHFPCLEITLFPSFWDGYEEIWHDPYKDSLYWTIFCGLPITTQKEHILDNNFHEFHVFWVVIMPKTLN